MNFKQIEIDMNDAYKYHKYDTLNEIYITLINLRTKLDKWFERYIDMFDEKMNIVQNTHPIWKLYNIKFDEYSRLNTIIRTAEYYMKKPQNV